MGKCIYCGKDAGLLRKSHKECEIRHAEGEKKIFQMATSASLGTTQLEALVLDLKTISERSFISPDETKTLLVKAFEAGIEKSLEDDILTENEENALTSYREHFHLTQRDLDNNGAYTRLVQAALLREVMNGKIPSRVSVKGDLPFNFQKYEQLVWLFQQVPYYEPRTRTTYSGGYSGVSVRVAKGLYWRTGGFRGNPVKHTEMIHIDTGLVGVTNKHVYFTGSVKSFRIKYQKIVSFSPFSDGIAIQRDAASAKSQVFKTGDGWFIYNLLTNLAKLEAA